MQLTSAKYKLLQKKSSMMPNDYDVIHIDSSDSNDADVHPISSSASSEVTYDNDTLRSNKNDKNKASQCLLECTLKAMDKQNPCMTARERVLNWNLATSIPLDQYPYDDLTNASLHEENIASNELSRVSPGKFKYSSTEKLKTSPQGKNKSISSKRDINLTNGHTRYQDYQLKVLKRYQEENCYPTIKLRCSYGTARKEPDIFKVPSKPMNATGLDVSQGRDSDTPTSDLAIGTGYDEKQFTKSATGNSAFDENNCSKDKSVNDVTGEENGTSTYEAPLSPKSYKEVLYKYLRIDTNPNQEKLEKLNKETPEKRRSLRVKVQQIALNNIAKFNKEQAHEKGKMDSTKSVSSCGNSKSSRSLKHTQLQLIRSDSKYLKNQERNPSNQNRQKSIDPPNRMVDAIKTNGNYNLMISSRKQENLKNIEEIKNGTAKVPSKTNSLIRKSITDDQSPISSPNSPKTSSLLLVKRTYGKNVQQDRATKNNNCIQYKSICFNPAVRSNANNLAAQPSKKDPQSSSITKPSMFERRNYEKRLINSDTLSTELKQFQAYQSKVLAEAVPTVHSTDNRLNSPTGTGNKKLKYSPPENEMSKQNEQINIQEMDVKNEVENDEKLKFRLRKDNQQQQQYLCKSIVSGENNGPLKSNGVNVQKLTQMYTENAVSLNSQSIPVNDNPTNQNDVVQKSLAQLQLLNIEKNKRQQIHRSRQLRQKYCRLSHGYRLTCGLRSRRRLSQPLLLGTSSRTKHHQKRISSKSNLTGAVAATASKQFEDKSNLLTESIDQIAVTGDDNGKSVNNLEERLPMMNNDISDQFNDCNNRLILAILHINNTVITVEKESISFWMCPSRIYTTFNGETKWKLLGTICRPNNDIEVESPYQNRICTNDPRPVYYEFRAKQIEPNEFRECYITSVYVCIYFIDKNQELSVQHVELDKIKCMAKTAHYIVLSDPGTFAMCCTEQAQNRNRSGIFKYKLELDMETLNSIKEFPWIAQNINRLKCIEDDKLLGFGDTVVAMWNHRTGDLLMNIDMELSIGMNLDSLMLTEKDGKCLYMVQYTNESLNTISLKLIAVTLTNSYTYKVLASHSIPEDFNRIVSTSMNNDRFVATCDNGNTLFLSLLHPNFVHFKSTKLSSTSSALPLTSHGISTRQVFVQNNRIYCLCSSNNQIVYKTIHEHFLNDD